MARIRPAKIEVPAATRDFAEGVVAEAEDAAHDFTAALQQALTTYGQQMAVVQTDMTAVGRSAIACLEKNLAVTFSFAHKLLHARDWEEIVRLQLEFLRAQSEVLARSTAKLGETAGAAALDIARS